MIQIECSVTSHFQSQLTLLKFNITPPQIAQVQVSSAAPTSNTYTVTLDIPKSQLDIINKRGGTLVDQGVNSYSINTLMLPCCMSIGHGISNTTDNRETNAPYLLQSSIAPSYSKEDIPSRNKVNGEINPPYLFNIITFCANEY